MTITLQPSMWDTTDREHRQCKTVSKLTNIPVASPNLLIQARLHQLWEMGEALTAGLKVRRILMEGYTLPFWIRPN